MKPNRRVTYNSTLMSKMALTEMRITTDYCQQKLTNELPKFEDIM